MHNWLIYPLTIADQQQHIDTSEHLLNTVGPDDPGILYWSMAQVEGLVLGFSQRQQILHPELREMPPLPIYHRRAGGTAVLVGPELLSLDVILPASHPLVLHDIVESYRWFGECWVAALQRFGITTRTVPPAEAHAQQALRKQPETQEREQLLYRACYGTLSPYEVVVGQRKLVGFDMIRRRQGSLLQAGLLLHWNAPLLARLLGHNAEEQETLRSGLQERAVGLDELSSQHIGINEIIAAFEQIVVSYPHHE